uniref:Vesicle transport protein n=2 Tax=Timema TaxID=61471 RepID=A0A7R9HSL6_9NEOP|nr:unnamed protein product [Timema cristinae]CAD7431140.1 unnamed protein product [Timema monikensis]
MDKLRRALSGDDAEEEAGIMPQFPATVSDMSFSVVPPPVFLWASCHFEPPPLFRPLHMSIPPQSLYSGSLSMFLGKGMVMFAVFYTLGNIISIGSTCFLMGPFNQVKKMFAPTRVIATILVIVLFGLTLFAAVGLGKAGLTLLFVILQCLAMTWYSLSYIPYARDAVKKTVSSCIA